MKIKLTILISAIVLMICSLVFSETDIYSKDRKTNHAVIAKKAETDERFRALLDLAEDYNLVIGIRKYTIGKDAKKNETLQQGYSWDFLTDKEDEVLAQHVEGLVHNWHVFPVEFIKKTGLNGILFMKNLKWHGMSVYGFELNDRVLLVNITLGEMLFYPGDEYFLYGIYHEFFHLIQNKFYSDKKFIDYDEWEKLNPSGFTYFEGGTMGMFEKYRDKPDFWELIHQEHPEKGFVSRYATSDVWHDTTETFCSLFVASRYKKAAIWIKKDTYLKAKMDYLIEALQKLYPGFNEKFFKKIHNVD